MRVGHSDSDGSASLEADLAAMPALKNQMDSLQADNQNSDNCEVVRRSTLMVEQVQTLDQDLISHFEDNSHFPQSYTQQGQLFNEGRIQEEREEEREESQEEEEQQEQEDLNVFEEEQDSDDEQIQQDQYQSDNSSDQNINSFDSLFYVAIDPFKTKVHDKVFLDPYQTINKGLGVQQNTQKPYQTLIREQQLQYQMLMNGYSARQNFLALINDNYFYRLEHEGRQQRSFFEESNQFNRTRQQEDDASSISDYKSQAESATEVRKGKRVVFKDVIQMKIFNHDDEVSAIRQSQELRQFLNTIEKPPTLRKFVQLAQKDTQMVSEAINGNRPRSYSNPQIMVDQQSHSKGDNNKQVNLDRQEDSIIQKWCNSINTSIEQDSMKLGQINNQKQQRKGQKTTDNVENIKKAGNCGVMQIELGQDMKYS